MLKKEPKKTNEENPLKKNRNLPTVEEAKAEDEVTKELQIRNLTNAAHIPQPNPTPPSCIPHRTLTPSCQRNSHERTQCVNSKPRIEAKIC